MIPEYLYNYLTLDIENDAEGSYKRKAGTPGVDPLVAIGLQNQEETRSFYLYPNGLDDLEIDEDVIVGWNLSHDLSFLWHLPSLQKFFLRGGRIWDAQLCHYILSGHQEKYPALREVGVRCYGCQEREKLMEPYWEEGKQTHEIPRELVLHDVEQDVRDTTHIYLQQLKQAEEQGVLKFLEYRNDAILACIEIERNGLYIDKTIFDRNKQKIKEELEQKKARLSELVKEYWK